MAIIIEDQITSDDTDDTEDGVTITTGEEQQDEPEEQEELSIELDGEVAEEETPLIKELRDKLRDTSRELSEYRKQAMPKIEVGAEPTLEGCEWDEDKFKAEYRAWTERAQKAANQEAEAQQQAQIRNQENQRRIVDYRAKAAALPVKDFQEAENAVISVLPDSPDRPFQQVLLNYSKDPAKLVYALAKYPAKLRSLAEQTDPIRVALMIQEMEGKMTVAVRKAPPPAEADSIQRGSASISSSGSDKQLEKLRADAMRTGDHSKVVAYKASMKKK